MHRDARGWNSKSYGFSLRLLLLARDHPEEAAFCCMAA
jgi:hypothetical protein